MGFDKFYCPVCGQPNANRGVCWSCQSRERYETQRQLDEQRRTADQIAYAAEAQMEHDRAVALITAAHQEQLARELDRDRKKEAERTFIRHTLHEIASQEVDNLTRAAARLGVFLGTQEYRRNVKLTEDIAVELGLGEAYLLAVLTRVEKADSEELWEFLDRMIQRSPTTYEIIIGSQSFRSRADYQRLRSHQEDYHARLAAAEGVERERQAAAKRENRLTRISRYAVYGAVGGSAVLLTLLAYIDLSSGGEAKLASIIPLPGMALLMMVHATAKRLAVCWVDRKMGRPSRFPGLMEGWGGRFLTALMLGAAFLGVIAFYFNAVASESGEGAGASSGAINPLLYWGGLVAMESVVLWIVGWLFWPRKV